MHNIHTKIIGQLIKVRNIDDALTYLRSLTYTPRPPKLLYNKLSFKRYPKHRHYAFFQIAGDNLSVGIKFDGKQVPKILIYYNGKFSRKIRKPWKDQGINFQRVSIRWKFPQELTHIERKKWRTEHFKLRKNPQLIASDFYNTWLNKIIFLGPDTNS